nr:hypothetical protein [Tanacetum cinerariifolium]
MLKVAKLYQEPEQSLIPPSKEVNADDIADKSLPMAYEQPVTQHKAATDLKIKKKKISSSPQPKSPHKVRVTLPKKQVTETQHAEVKVATDDVTKSLEASELAEEQGNQPSAVEAKKVTVVKYKGHCKQPLSNFSRRECCWTKLINETKLFKKLHRSPYDTESKIKVVKSYFTSQIPKLQDQIMHDADESADYESMREDDLRSVSGFKDADFDNTQGNDVSHSDHTFLDHNAFAERLSLPDHLDHIYEEVSFLHLKLGTMESYIIHQVLDGIKSTFPVLVTIALQEQLPGLLPKTLRDCLPSIIQEYLQTYIQASSKKFARLESKLSKTLKSDMGNSVKTLVKSEMKEVRDEKTMIVDDTTKEEKNKKAKDPSPATTQGEPQSAEPLVKKEKKSEEIISVEDDSDEDDKQPLSKRFKIMTPILDIPNPTHLNTFVLEHLLKPKEQQKSIKEFTDQLFKTTSSRFSPTLPRELTPPRNSSKGKATAIIEEPGNELVDYQEE